MRRMHKMGSVVQSASVIDQTLLKNSLNTTQNCNRNRFVWYLVQTNNSRETTLYDSYTQPNCSKIQFLWFVLFKKREEKEKNLNIPLSKRSSIGCCLCCIGVNIWSKHVDAKRSYEIESYLMIAHLRVGQTHHNISFKL